MDELRKWYREKGICYRCGQAKAEKGRRLCLLCLDKDAERHRIARAAMSDEQRKQYNDYSGKKHKELQNHRRAKGLCPYCGRNVKNGEKQCGICRAKKKAAAERFRRKNGIEPRFMLLESPDICSTCGKPAKAGFKVCEDCYRHLCEAGEKGRAALNRKEHIWQKNNRFIFMDMKKEDTNANAKRQA